jgi:translation elongation factor EF-G
VQVEAGNIVAIAGLKEARTGDTLVGMKDVKTKDFRLHGIDCPEPVFTCSIEAMSTADADALEAALACLTREDPSVRVVNDEETGQLLLSGMGELHLDVVLSRLRLVSVSCPSGAVCCSHVSPRAQSRSRSFPQVALPCRVHARPDARGVP